MPDILHPDTEPTPQSAGSGAGLLIVSWLWVGVPLAWGVWTTIDTSLALFR